VVLSGCLKLTDDSVVTMARNCPDMKEMQLAGLGFLTGAARTHAPCLWMLTLLRNHQTSL
jgi:hypothetical protein